MRLGLGWLTEHWWLKLVSLGLAIGFWFYVVGEESIEITKTVPLEVISPSEKLSVVKSSTYFLETTLQAPRNLISAFPSMNISASHKIEGTQKPGEYSFTVSYNDFSLPAPTIRIVKIFPTVITVTLDEMIVKKLPVQVETAGEAAFGYRVDEGQIELDPNAVLVEGPKEALEKMDMIKTEPVQLVGRVRSFRRTVKIQQPNGIRVIGDGITEVQIPVKAEYAEKELTDVPVKPLGTPVANHYPVLEESQVSVVLKGPRALVDKLASQDFLAYVNVEDLKEGVHQLPVSFVLPADIVLKNDPPAVPVEIKKV